MAIELNTAKELDKFYTSPEASETFYNNVCSVIDLTTFDNIVEPSCGSGALLKNLPEETIALDLFPEMDGVIQQDFFDFQYPEGKTLTYMNPPFGKRSKLAIDFFNKAAEHSTAIACIIPVTWEKYSIQNRLKKGWALVFSERLPEKSFVLEGKPYSVRCVQQVWVSPEEFNNGLHQSA